MLHPVKNKIKETIRPVVSVKNLESITGIIEHWVRVVDRFPSLTEYTPVRLTFICPSSGEKKELFLTNNDKFFAFIAHDKDGSCDIVKQTIKNNTAHLLVEFFPDEKTYKQHHFDQPGYFAKFH